MAIAASPGEGRQPSSSDLRVRVGGQRDEDIDGGRTSVAVPAERRRDPGPDHRRRVPGKPEYVAQVGALLREEIGPRRDGRADLLQRVVRSEGDEGRARSDVGRPPCGARQQRRLQPRAALAA